MTEKFIEIVDTNEYEVLTPAGWKDFKGIGKTVPYDVYEISLDNDMKLRCADDHIVMSEDTRILAKDLKPGDVISTSTGQSSVKNITKLDIPPENMFDLIDVNGSVYYTNDIISHNSTVVSAYALWYSVFHSDKFIGIVSNKQMSAIHILSIIRRMYEGLPSWIKPGVKEYSKTFVSFDNGTRIEVSATSVDAFRGRPLNLLFCDEFAFVRKGIAEEFWSANYPAVSASTKSKIIIVSTPNGMFNLFHRLYSGAERKENTFKHLKYTWRAVPDRDEKWAEESRQNLGPVRFAQEQECEFLGSINTVIDTEVLENLFLQTVDPQTFELDKKLRIYEKPEKGSTYVIGCDVAKGTGEHYSTIQVLKIINLKPISLKQVAVFESNTTDVYAFSSIINRVSLYYNNAYILVENNSEGSTVVGRLWWDYENGGLINSGSKSTDLGIRATRSSKPKAVLYMKRIIEDGSLIILDGNTVNQLSSFVEKNGKFFGKDMPDDLVSGLYWACYLFTMQDVLNEGAEFKNEDIEEDGWGILTDMDEVEENWEWLNDITLLG